MAPSFCPVPSYADELIAYGYRYGDRPMEAVLPVAPSTKIVHEPLPPGEKNQDRRPMLSQIGPVFEGACLPHPDLNDPLSAEAGVRKRFAFDPPRANPDKLARLKVFVADWLKTNLTPLSPTLDTSVEAWLAKTKYPQWRKNELLRKWRECPDPRSREWWKCKSFVKDEFYATFKHLRAINSRSDEFKCLVGPYFKLIEEEVYKLKEFIKHIPVADRPAYIRGMLDVPGSTFMETDYSAFESLFTEEIYDAVELQLYRYMTQYIDGGKEFADIVEEVLPGENVCKFKWFRVHVRAKRMSGEMCTSLGNGFQNLMLMLFLAHENKCEDVVGVVEGDDGLFGMRGQRPTAEQFLELGFVIKIAEHNDLTSASFCGLIFDPEDGYNVTDAMQEIVTFGWGSRRYLDARRKKKRILLRCKALSMAHQYPGCPLLGNFSHAILRSTRDVAKYVESFVKRTPLLNQWDREQTLLAVRDERLLKYVAPPPRTRMLYERKFGVVVEHQIIIERQLDEWDGLSNLPRSHPTDLYLHADWEEYWDNYVCPRGAPCALLAHGPHVKQSDFMTR